MCTRFSPCQLQKFDMCVRAGWFNAGSEAVLLKGLLYPSKQSKLVFFQIY